MLIILIAPVDKSNIAIPGSEDPLSPIVAAKWRKQTAVFCASECMMDAHVPSTQTNEPTKELQIAN
jgi:hypothetical protein